MTILLMLFCVVWLLIYGHLIWILKKLPPFQLLSPWFKEPGFKEPDDFAWPRLSVVIPARNEADHLESALSSLLAQDYPNLEIIVVNDRSTDATGRILNHMASTDARVIALDVEHLPRGWLGKVHALERGSWTAGGDWLLFTDADVSYAPGLLRRAVHFSEKEKLDHLTLLPSLQGGGFMLRIAMSAFEMMFLLVTGGASANRPGSRRFVGIGAFNLVRNTCLRRTPGFQWLRLEPGDDMGLGLMVKNAGGVTRFAQAIGELSVPWYGSMGAMFKGLEKNMFAAGCHYQWWRLVVHLGVTWTLLIAPWAALWFGWSWQSSWLLAAAAATFFAQLVFSFTCLLHGVKMEVLWRLLMPLGLGLCSLMLLWSGFRCLKNGGIEWRGTVYPTAELKAGQRVKL